MKELSFYRQAAFDAAVGAGKMTGIGKVQFGRYFSQGHAGIGQPGIGQFDLGCNNCLINTNNATSYFME